MLSNIITNELKAQARDIKYTKNSIPIATFNYQEHSSVYEQKYQLTAPALVLFINGQHYVYKGKIYYENQKQFLLNVKNPDSELLKSKEDYEKFVRLSGISLVYFGKSHADLEYKKFVKYHALFPLIKFGHIFDYRTQIDLSVYKKTIVANNKFGDQYTFYKLDNAQDLTDESEILKFYKKFGYNAHIEYDTDIKNKITNLGQDLIILFINGDGSSSLTGKVLDKTDTEAKEILIEHDQLTFKDEYEKIADVKNDSSDRKVKIYIGSLKDPVVRNLVHTMRIDVDYDIPLQIYSHYSNQENRFIKYKLPVAELKNTKNMKKVLEALNQFPEEQAKYRYYKSYDNHGINLQKIKRFENEFRNISVLTANNLPGFFMDKATEDRNTDSSINIILFYKIHCPYSNKALKLLKKLSQTRIFSTPTAQLKVNFGLFDFRKNEVPGFPEQTQVQHKISNKARIVAMKSANWSGVANWKEFALQDFNLDEFYEQLSYLNKYFFLLLINQSII